jgi:hypothetical protein
MSALLVAKSTNGGDDKWMRVRKRGAKSSGK